MRQMNNLQREVLFLLDREQTSYAKTLNSEDIGRALNVSAAYIRSQLAQLVRGKQICVRRGNGGGYYANREDF